MYTTNFQAQSVQEKYAGALLLVTADADGHHILQPEIPFQIWLRAPTNLLTAPTNLLKALHKFHNQIQWVYVFTQQSLNVGFRLGNLGILQHSSRTWPGLTITST